MSDLEKRIETLEALEAIRQLKARYCEICDDAHNPDEIIRIFTEDGIWEGEGIGRAEGHDAIKELFQGFQDAISFSQHMVQNPIIDVQGSTATARWYFFGMFKFYRNDTRRWQAARYHEAYERVSGTWKIKHLKIAPPTMSVKYETGW